MLISKEERGKEEIVASSYEYESTNNRAFNFEITIETLASVFIK